MSPMWSHVVQRKWILSVNLIIGFTIFIYILGYNNPSQHTESYRLKDFAKELSLSNRDVLTCSPKKNIVFLKTHKCASSSVQNILLRYAHQNNLTVVLPVTSRSHYLSRLRPFRKEMVASAPWANLGYNILCHHMVFNQAELEKLMPTDSIFISIVRNPVDLFESMYEYDKLEEFYKMDIEEYSRATKNASTISKIRNRANGLGRNPMLYDFGVNPKLYNSHKAILEIIKKLDERFDFVMVAEYFDESIVILRHILCWDIDYMVSLTINARMQSFKKNLSQEASTSLRHWHWGDVLLYNHFLTKFQRTIEEFGKEKLAKEVQELRQKREDWFHSCVEQKVHAKNLTVYNIWSSKVVGFKLKSNISNETCEDLVKPEKFFTDEIRQHQLLRALAKDPTRAFTVYRMIDLSKLSGKEKEEAQKILISYFKGRKFKKNKKALPIKEASSIKKETSPIKKETFSIKKEASSIEKETISNKNT